MKAILGMQNGLIKFQVIDGCSKARIGGHSTLNVSVPKKMNVEKGHFIMVKKRHTASRWVITQVRGNDNLYMANIPHNSKIQKGNNIRFMEVTQPTNALMQQAIDDELFGTFEPEQIWNDKRRFMEILYEKLLN